LFYLWWGPIISTIKKALKYKSFLAPFVLSVIPSSTFAAFGAGPFFGGGCHINTDDPGTGDVECLIKNITDWALGAIGLICVLMIIIGGVRYIVSAGNQTQTEGAKKTIVGAIIGLIIVILSDLMVNVVMSLL